MPFPHGMEVDWLRVQVRSGEGRRSTSLSLVASDETSSSLSTSRATRLREQQQQSGSKHQRRLFSELDRTHQHGYK